MINMFRQEDINRIYKTGIIAVLVIDDAKDGISLANALLEGGVDVMELTLRTPAALDALKEIISNVPEMLAGIGTILTKEQVLQVADAGAAFGVAPGLNPEIVKEAQKAGLPFSPGIVTPSDIEQAIGLGCRLLKFFPAEPAGGIDYLKSITAPYAHLNLQFIPLGGLNEENFKSYLEFPPVIAVGGSWIAKRDAIKKNDWKTITENARNAVKIVKELRGK